MLRQGDTDGALSCYQQALELRTPLAQSKPESVEPNRDLASIHTRLGDVKFQQGNTDEALTYYKSALAISQSLADIHRENTVVQRDLGLNFTRVGNITLRLDQTEEAMDFYQQGTKILKALSDADPQNTVVKRDLGGCYERLGDTTLQLGNAKDAMEHYKKGLEISQVLAKLAPGNSEAQRDLSINTEKLGDVLMAVGQPADATPYYETALEISRRLAVADPKNAQAQSDVGFGYLKLGQVMSMQGRYKEAIEYHLRVLKLRQTIAKEDDKNAQAQTDVYRSYCLLADAAMGQADDPSAQQWLITAKERLESMLQQGWYADPNQLIGGENVEENKKQLESKLSLCENAPQAISDINFVLAQDVLQPPKLMHVRVKGLLKQNQTEDAIASVERLVEWIESQEGDRNLNRYNAACQYALCAAASETDRDKAIDQAIALLEKAKSGGYFESEQIAQLKQDSDFVAIRSDPKFSFFVDALEPTEDQ